MDRVSKILSDLIPAGVGWGCWRAEKVAPQEKFPCVLSALVYTYKKGGGCLISTAV